jgi:hypothetical protein
MPEAGADALDDLRARLRATQKAAERLAEEAATMRPPAAGWEAPRAAEETNAELQALVGLLATLRDTLPPELREQVSDLVRQLLLLVRAILDWWIGRLEADPEPRPPEGGRDVEDIPIS